MRRVAKVGAVGAVVAALVLGMSGVASAKKVSDKKYAKAVCTAYSSTADSIEEYISAYNGSTTSEPVAFQQETVQLTTALIAEIEANKAKLAKVTPDAGKKITRNFTANLQAIIDDISEALAKFQAADPNGVAFQADVSVFQTSINLLDVNLLGNDPFPKVKDQDLLEAFGDEKTCDDVVTIYGA